MKEPLTFNSAELAGHTIIIVIFLESIQETVQGEKNHPIWLNWYRDINSQKVDIAKFRNIPLELTIFSML